MIRIALTLALVLVTSGGTEAANYFVSTTGKDTNTGGSRTPWRTLKRSLTALRPGDRLYVRGGTYVERLKGFTIRPGTESAPITVAAYPGERPVLRGLLWLSRPSFWRIDGLNVSWDDATGLKNEHMVKLTNGVGWSFRNAEVWGARSYAALLVASTLTGEPSAWRISGCWIHDTYASNDTNQDHLIYVNSGLSGSGGIIERNVLYHAPNGTGIKLGGPSAEAAGTARVTVRYNTIYAAAQSILVAWGSRDNTLHRNLLVRAAGSYGAIRGYQLQGPNNAATENLVWEARLPILNDAGYEGVWDGGGNLFPVDPWLDGDFAPLNPVAQDYGRYAPNPAAGQ
jgi:hypothetical protein